MALKRGKDFITVGFWNIEKKNRALADPDQPYGVSLTPTSEFVTETVARMYSLHHVDVMILAEVTDSRGMGSFFIDRLANRLSAIGFPKPAFRGDFKWSETDAGTKSVCNFGFVWNEKVEGLQGLGDQADWVWQPDDVRPMLVLPAGFCVLGAIHAKAVIRDVAMRQIIESATHLEETNRPAMLIGDMNVPFDSVPVYDKRAMRQLGWEQVSPKVAPTHVTRGYDEFGNWEGKREAVLDYCWRNGGLPQCIAENPCPGYNAWDYVDHAPIMYHIARKAGELPFLDYEMSDDEDHDMGLVRRPGFRRPLRPGMRRVPA